MTNEELIKLAYDMGAHPYSVGGMVAALQKGIEIGKEEQKAIDDKEYTEEMQQLNEEWKANLVIQRAMLIDKVDTIIRNLDLRKCMVGGCVMTAQIAISVRKAMEE